MKEIILWIVAGVLLTASLLLAADILLNHTNKTLTGPMPLMRGDG
jgi:hypothetical protein